MIDQIVPKKKRIKVLIIKGGGVFGMIPICFLQTINDIDWQDEIDFFGGSSVGGIIILYLATGKSPRGLYHEFKEAAPKIFQKRLIKKICPIFPGPMYGAKNIEDFLKKAMPYKMGDLIYKVIVPTINFKIEEPRIFDNLDGSIDLNYDVWKVARATSAAPTYFPAFGEDIFIDGGIIENLPVMTTFTTLRDRYGYDLKDIDVFLLGTGSKDVVDKDLAQVNRYGYLQWATNLIAPFVTKANEIASKKWGENMGFGYFKYYNPIVIQGRLDDANLITNGKLEAYCESRLGEFRREFLKFLNH